MFIMSDSIGDVLTKSTSHDISSIKIINNTEQEFDIYQNCNKINTISKFSNLNIFNGFNINDKLIFKNNNTSIIYYIPNQWTRRIIIMKEK